VMHRYKSPVGDNTRNAHGIWVVGSRGRTGDEILDRRGVEQLDVGELKHLAEQSRREERSMLHDDKVALIFVRHANLVQELLSGLAHHHGAEELATEPGTTARGNTGLNHGDLEVGTLGGERVCRAETAGSRTNDDDIRFGVVVQVIEVATCHGARDLRLTDGSKRELLPVVLHLSERLCNAIGGRLHSIVLLEAQAIASVGSGDVESGSRRRHIVEVDSGELETYDLLRLTP
jgi:hypothetical protein